MKPEYEVTVICPLWVHDTNDFKTMALHFYLRIWHVSGDVPWKAFLQPETQCQQRRHQVGGPSSATTKWNHQKFKNHPSLIPASRTKMKSTWSSQVLSEAWHSTNTAKCFRSKAICIVNMFLIHQFSMHFTVCLYKQPLRACLQLLGRLMKTRNQHIRSRGPTRTLKRC